MNKFFTFLIFFIGLFSFRMNNRVYVDRPVVIEDEITGEEILVPTAYSNITEISMTQFRSFVESRGKTIIILTGSSCSHCKAYKPNLNAILYDNNLHAYELDVWSLSSEEVSEVKEHVGEFYGVPYTVLISNGQVVTTVEGNQSQANIKNILRNNGFIN